MGLLDNLLNASTGGAEPQVHQGLLQHVMGMVSNPQTGGLGGLLDQLKAGGLGSAVESWVGNGPNQPVSGQQITSALGQQQIAALAQKFGLPPDQVSAHLSQILPELVNHLTPNGQVPHPDMVSSAMGLLKGKLFGG